MSKDIVENSSCFEQTDKTCRGGLTNIDLLDALSAERRDNPKCPTPKERKPR